jgi:voltage-gated potassium channel
MDSSKRIILSLALVLFFLLAGTSGYMLLEDYTLLEAVYMAVISITTVGYGEVQPLSDGGKVFTMFLLLFGVGSLAFAAHAFIESMIERASNPVREKKIMQKKIDRLENHTIICGHGRVGAAAAEHLADAGKDFVVLENSQEEIAVLQEKHFLYLTGDATSEKTLIAARIKTAGALMALLNSDPDNLFTVLTARELNPTLHIVARSESAYAESKILRAGADSIISPYASAGRRVADKVMAYSRHHRMQGSTYEAVGGHSMFRWIDVDDESGLVDHSVAMASSFVEGQIVGIRRSGKDLLSPTPDTPLAMGDRLLVIDVPSGDEDQSCPEQPQKIVLVDDNPVIRRLYTRLFQKAGFNIMTAATGREGEALILKEQPDAAVVDYLLGDITGLEVCKDIRENETGQSVKLILFTADDSPEVHEEAINNGVDIVVVKSPDAAEIVNHVAEAIKVEEKTEKRVNH